eukprot:6209884-Pleurochrysis_carterae.AAC.1
MEMEGFKAGPEEGGEEGSGKQKRRGGRRKLSRAMPTHRSLELQWRGERSDGDRNRARASERVVFWCWRYCVRTARVHVHVYVIN